MEATVSTQRVLLISLDKLEEAQVEIKDLKSMSNEQKKQLAFKDLSMEEFVAEMNLADSFRNYDLENIHCELYDSNPDYIFARMYEADDDLNLVIDEKLELHIRKEEDNYSIDAYKYFDQNSDDTDHDYEDDFISALGWVSKDDLED